MRQQVNIRLPKITIQQINELAEKFEDSQAFVIVMAVKQLHMEIFINHTPGTAVHPGEAAKENQMCNHNSVKTEVYLSKSEHGKTVYSFGWLSPGERMSVHHMPSNALKCADCGELLEGRRKDLPQID